jgi:hypothetical protein
MDMDKTNKTGRFTFFISRGGAFHPIATHISEAISDGRNYLIQICPDRIDDSDSMPCFEVSLTIVLADYKQCQPGEVTVFPPKIPAGVTADPPPATMQNAGEIKYDPLDWIAPDGNVAYRRRSVGENVQVLKDGGNIT